MDSFRQAELEELISCAQGPCISLYAPMIRTGPQTEQNRIRFRGLVDSAQGLLEARGMRAAAARDLLAPWRALAEDALFWRSPGDGLACFLAPGFMRAYRLPLRFAELVTVGQRFHLRPLFSLFSNDGRYYVLALSQKEVRLLEGTRYSIAPVDLEGVPRSLADALGPEGAQRYLQWHTAGGAPRLGDRAVVFHGSSLADETKSRILRYFQRLDRALEEMLATQQVPLVLAAVEYLMPLYRQASSYPNLMPEGIAGSPESMTDQGLQARAWQIVEPFYQRKCEQALSRLQQLLGTGLATTDPALILPAAFSGCVDTLFLAEGQSLWGSFDPASNALRLSSERQPEDSDLADEAAVQTIRQRGTLHVVPAGKLGPDTPMAAILRY